MTASLVDLLHPAFSLEQGGVRYERDAILARARGLGWSHELAGTVVRGSARTPLDALVHFEGCLRVAALFVPDAGASAGRDNTDGLAPQPGEVLALRTSGSTGTPRHAAFTFESLSRSAERVAASLSLTSDDVVGLMLPCDHGFGLVAQLLAAASVGARVVWVSGAFPVQRVAALVEARATVVALVPFGLAQLLPAMRELGSAPLPSLRQVGVAGGALSSTLAAGTQACLPHVELLHHYGCTEAGPRLTSVAVGDAAFESGSVGRALPGVQVSVHTPDSQGRGELVFESDMAMTRYLEDPAHTEAATVATPSGVALRTGDVGHVTPDGLVYVTGRSDDVVKLRGEKVSLAAVARAAEHVGAAAAFAHHAPRAGTEPDGGIVVLYEGEAALSPRHFVAALPKGIVPKLVIRVAALPRTRSGKIDRVAAADLATSHSEHQT